MSKITLHSFGSIEIDAGEDRVALAQHDAGGVRLRFKAGHDRIPPPVKQAVLLLVGQWYRNRMAINVGNIVSELPNGVKALLAMAMPSICRHSPSTMKARRSSRNTTPSPRP